MRTETKSYRVLFPDEGKYLYNAKTDYICEAPPVYLVSEADPADWVDITDAQKLEIEAERARVEAKCLVEEGGT